MYGSYLLGKPVLTITDPETIRHVLVKDFDTFVDREGASIKQMLEGGSIDWFWRNQMTTLSGDKWKDVRSTFSPIFTSGKMKGMMKFILEVGNDLAKEVSSLADQGEDFECKDLFGKFSLDSVASCSFGINPKSFENKSGVFLKNAASMSTTTVMDGMKLMTRIIPGGAWIHKKLGINAIKPKPTMFFVETIRQAIRHRRGSGERRNDMIDLMIDCMKDPDSAVSKGDIEEDQYEKDMKLNYVRKSKEMFDEDTVVATAMVMLMGGYDTTSLTLSFMAYYLSQNLEIQEKLQEEIDQAFEDNDEKMPEYNTIQSLPYMDMCIKETLRLSSIVGAITRTCGKPYTIPDTNIHLEKDDLVMIPARGIHYDERYYPNPKQFIPEHFSKEAKQSRSPYTFLPFGQGPRNVVYLSSQVLISLYPSTRKGGGQDLLLKTDIWSVFSNIPKLNLLKKKPPML